MKALIIFLILVIYIIFWGVPQLKESYLKSYKKGGGDNKEPADYKKPEYFNLNQVWTPDKNSTFVQKTGSNEVKIEESSSCNVYTYENYYSVDRVTKDGSLNTLESQRIAKPSLDNVFEDLVNGYCHVTGKKNTSNVTCTDPDQIHAVRKERKCELSTDNENKCIDSKGFVVERGETEYYNKKCSENICPGELGCISLNYFDDGVNISNKTMCLSIKEIKVNTDTQKYYDLTFFNLLGIITTDNDAVKDALNGPFPITFDFNFCNTVDPKQKFKITRYKFEKDDDGLSVTKKLVVSKTGSYASIVFRGLNAYLDSDKIDGVSTGTFVLKPLNQSKIKESVKWILMPELQITNNTIPSFERCMFIRSNATTITGGTQITEDLGAATGIRRAVEILGSKGDKKAQEILAKKIFDRSVAPWAPGHEVTNTFSKRAARAWNKVKNFKPLTRFFIRQSVEKIVGALNRYAGPIMILFTVLEVFSLLFPDITFKNPPILPAAVPQGFRAIPTQYPSSYAWDSRPGRIAWTSGLFNNTFVERFCTEKEQEKYPEYFLESITNGKNIQPEMINYKYARGPKASIQNINIGGDKVHGILFYDSPGNLTVNLQENSWKDGDTEWKIYKGPERFDESLGFPTEYFKGGFKGVTGFNVLSAGSSGSGFNRISRQSSVTSLSFSEEEDQIVKRIEREKDQNDLEVGFYQNVPTDGGKGSGLTLNLLTSVLPSGTTTNFRGLTSFEIESGGEGYDGDTGNNQQVTVKKENIGGMDDLTFTITKTETEEFIFKALVRIGEEGDYTYYVPEDPALDSFNFESITVNYGFSGLSEYPLKTNSPSEFTIITSGFNYNSGTIYLAQYDSITLTRIYPPLPSPGSNEKSYKQDSEDLNNFFQIEVTETSSPSFGYNNLAPSTLVGGTAEEIENFTVNYNFMTNSPADFSPSPQQIIYGGETDEEGNTLIDNLSEEIPGRLTPQKVSSLFLNIGRDNRKANDGIVIPGPNSILNLKSIQISTIKYQEMPAPVQTAINTETSKVILGRFIPYQKMTPVSRRVAGITTDPDSGDKDTVTDSFAPYYGTDKTYYNWNYTQIIPYGIQNVYTNSNFIKSAPKF